MGDSMTNEERQTILVEQERIKKEQVEERRPQDEQRKQSRKH
jgi:hypothetical protein